MPASRSRVGLARRHRHRVAHPGGRVDVAVGRFVAARVLASPTKPAGAVTRDRGCPARRRRSFAAHASVVVLPITVPLHPWLDGDAGDAASPASCTPLALPSSHPVTDACRRGDRYPCPRRSLSPVERRVVVSQLCPGWHPSRSCRCCPAASLVVTAKPAGSVPRSKSTRYWRREPVELVVAVGIRGGRGHNVASPHRRAWRSPETLASPASWMPFLLASSHTRSPISAFS